MLDVRVRARGGASTASAFGDGGELEATDRRDHPDALMRSLMVVVLDPRVDRRLRSREIERSPVPAMPSLLSVLWNRSTFPVVVGDRAR